MSIKKIISTLIIIFLLFVLSINFFLTKVYFEKITTYFDSLRKSSVQEHRENQKNQTQQWSKQFHLLIDSKYSKLEEEIEKELQERVSIAYQTARAIYEKHKKVKSKKDIQERIIESLEKIQYYGAENHIFITNYQGDAILLGDQNIDKDNLSNYLDADARSIVLEEIQKVRKYGEGFLKSKQIVDNEKEIIFVKDFGAYDWFIGTNIKVKEKEAILKSKLLEMLKDIPMEDSKFIAVYDKEKKLLLERELKDSFSNEELSNITNRLSSENLWHESAIKNYYFYNMYNESLGWNLVYGFDISSAYTKALDSNNDLELILEKENNLIMKISIVFFVVILLVVLLKRKR